MASKADRTAGVIISNYHDVDKRFPDASIAVKVTGIPADQVAITHFRIDQTHSNAYELWKKMGSPQHPDTKQISQLEEAGQLQSLGMPEKLSVNQNEIILPVTLPGQAVSLIKIDW